MSCTAFGRGSCPPTLVALQSVIRSRFAAIIIWGVYSIAHRPDHSQPLQSASRPKIEIKLFKLQFTHNVNLWNRALIFEDFEQHSILLLFRLSTRRHYWFWFRASNNNARLNQRVLFGFGVVTRDLHHSNKVKKQDSLDRRNRLLLWPKTSYNLHPAWVTSYGRTMSFDITSTAVNSPSSSSALQKLLTDGRVTKMLNSLRDSTKIRHWENRSAA